MEPDSVSLDQLQEELRRLENGSAAQLTDEQLFTKIRICSTFIAVALR